MPKEYEVDILNINREEAVARLNELGAKHVGTHHFRRMEFRLEGDSDAGHSWIRVRTDGKKTTLTMKTYNLGGFNPMDEYEVETGGFEDTIRIMSRLAKSRCIYFENDRDAYRLDDLYITLDKWPEIPLFMEIEAPDEAKLRAAAAMIGIKGELIGNCVINDVYKRYGLTFLEVVGKNDHKLKELLSED